MYGDYEPEDSWDASDPPLEQVANLGARVALLDGEPEPRATNIDTLLDVITDRLERRRRAGPLFGRDFLRAAQLVDDIRFVRARL